MARRFYLSLLLLMALATGACQRHEVTDGSSLDISGAEFGKDFSLSDPDGRFRSLREFRGKAVLIFFGFTQCPDVCPTALSRAAEVRRQLGKDADRLQVLFVTVDPERDTPQVLKSYTQAFDPGFIGLSTDMANTRKTAEAFRIFYQKVPTGGSYTMDHSAISYLYDTQGKPRLAIRPSATSEQVTRDVQELLNS